MQQLERDVILLDAHSFSPTDQRLRVDIVFALGRQQRRPICLDSISIIDLSVLGSLSVNKKVVTGEVHEFFWRQNKQQCLQMSSIVDLKRLEGTHSVCETVVGGMIRYGMATVRDSYDVHES